MKQLQAMAECDSLSEERIRLWCVDVLRTALGYRDVDLDYELSAANKKIDIAVKHDDDVIMIIECKKRDRLKESDRQQALNYAMSRSAEWAVVTNGRSWELLRVIPIKGQNPQAITVFSISLLDEDGLSNYDVERMYLLTKKALLRGEPKWSFIWRNVLTKIDWSQQCSQNAPYQQSVARLLRHTKRNSSSD